MVMLTILLVGFIVVARGDVDLSNVRGKSEQEETDQGVRRNLLDPRFAFPTVVSAYLPAPFITAGACNAGTKYKIQKVADLYNFLDQIECVFHAGLTPTTIGLGYNYGTLLMAANTAWPATVSETVYQGDYVVRTWCKDNYYNIGVLNIAGLDVGISNIYVGDLPGEVTEGEYWDGKKSMIADFRIDVRVLCPVEGNESTFGLQGFVPFRNSIPPVNGYVDTCRVVGRDSRDGGLVLLCKAYSTSDHSGYSTVLYYGLKNFDKRVNVVDESGTRRVFAPTPDGEEIFVTQDFTYSRKGVRGAIEGLPTSLDVLNMQKMVAQRDAIDTIISNSILGEFTQRREGFQRYPEDAADTVSESIGGSGFAQAVMETAGNVQGGLASAAEQLSQSPIGQIPDAAAIKDSIRGSVGSLGLKDRLVDAGSTLAEGIQTAVSGGRDAIEQDL